MTYSTENGVRTLQEIDLSKVTLVFETPHGGESVVAWSFVRQRPGRSRNPAPSCWGERFGRLHLANRCESIG